MGRAPCCEKVGLKRGRWSSQEDELLVKYMQANGEGSWRTLPKNAGLLRCGKSCRLRWINYLKPNLKRGKFTSQEDETIVKLQYSLGNRWSLISTYLPGRTDNEIKNYWNSHLRRRMYTFMLKNKHIEKTTLELPKRTIVVGKSLRKQGRVSLSKAKKYNNNSNNTTTYVSTLKIKSSCLGADGGGGATWSGGDYSVESHLSKKFTVDTEFLALPRLEEETRLAMQQNHATPENQEVCNNGMWSFDKEGGHEQILLEHDDQHIEIIGPLEKNEGDVSVLLEKPNYCLNEFEEGKNNWWSTMNISDNNFLEGELWVQDQCNFSLDMDFGSIEESTTYCDDDDDMLLWLWNDS